MYLVRTTQDSPVSWMLAAVTMVVVMWLLLFYCVCMYVFSLVHHLLLVSPTEQPQLRSPAP